MLKINYEFTAIEPLFTGSDKTFGIERKFRKEPVILLNPIKIKSKFKTELQRRKAIVDLLIAIWNRIDFEGMSGTRRMKIYDEFYSKMVASTGVRTKYQFLNKFCENFGIKSISDTNLIAILDKFDDNELLQQIRDESQYLILLMRAWKEEKKKGKSGEYDLFNIEPEKEIVKGDLIFEKYYDEVPIFSGNSIRGKLRRDIMYDFLKQVGLNILDKRIYNQLFTGGNLTMSTGNEDIEMRETYQKYCPPIALLGTATAGQTFEGDLKVGRAKLRCIENENGDKSYWEQLSIDFGTRLDSSKHEKEIGIEGEMEETSQMLYLYEVVNAGAVFVHNFGVTTDNELIISCFWRMVELFKENNYIGGNSARGYGQINLDNIKVPKNASKLYLEYLKENKEQIQKYFENKNKKGEDILK